jgi:hypothetical protein
MDQILIIGIMLTAYGITWLIFETSKRIKHKLLEVSTMNKVINIVLKATSFKKKDAKKFFKICVTTIKRMRKGGFSQVAIDNVLHDFMYRSIATDRKMIIAMKMIKETGMPLLEATRIAENWFRIGEDMGDKGASDEDIQYMRNGYYTTVMRAHLEGAYHG